MTTHSYDLVPEAHRDTARLAVTAAIGPQNLDALVPVFGGASGALTYRAEAGARSYLLRLETRRGPLRNPHQYTCMQIASDAEIAPTVRYVDDGLGVVVMDWVVARPIAEHPGGAAGYTRALGELIGRLQATEPFPALGDYATVVARMLDRIRASGMFAAGLLDGHIDAFERIRAAYPWGTLSPVSSHNDPNARNVLFDGARLWLVDWEASYRNDPFVDVAIVVDAAAHTPELLDELLAGWRGRPADDELRARLALMRPFTRLYYAGLLLIGFAGTRSAPDTDLVALSPQELGAALAAGTLKAGSPDMMYALGKMMLAGFMNGIRQPEFERALAVMRNG